MDYIRCNKCYQPPQSTNPPFLLTQCGHIFCHKCVGNDKQCLECKISGIDSLPLTQPLPDRVASLFIPASELFDRFLLAYKFQHTQMMISIRRLQDIEKKYNTVKMAYWKLKKYADELLKVNQQLHNSRVHTQTIQKVAPNQRSQAYVNIPRSYFDSNNYSVNNNTQNIKNRQNHLIANSAINRATAVQFKLGNTPQGYQTDDSMSSLPNNRLRDSIETPPITPDTGIFRMPNMKNLPRSTGSSLSNRGANSNNSSTRNNMF